jgi:hypothetical protein
MELCQQVVTVTRPGASITTDRSHADGKGTMGASSWGNSFRNCKLRVGELSPPFLGRKLGIICESKGAPEWTSPSCLEYVQFNTYWMSCN